MKRNKFFAPWPELRAKLRGTNADVIEVLMYFFERTIAILLSCFVLSVVFRLSFALGEAILWVVSWLAALYLALLFIFLLFKPRQ